MSSRGKIRRPSRKSARLEEINYRENQATLLQSAVSASTPPSKSHSDQVTLLQPAVPARPLSEANLRAHNKTLEMAGTGKRKQPLSSASSEEVISVQTQESAVTPACYRSTILKQAMMYFETWPAPESICNQINTITDKIPSLERKNSLASATDILFNKFAKVLKRASIEDGGIELFDHILSSMDQLEHPAISRKADWHPSLKPLITPFSILNFVSSQACGVASLEIDSSAIKTPRPDIAIGIDTDVLIRKMSSEILDVIQARTMLYYLQQTTTNQKPLLCSEPTSQPTVIRFPFLIIEGKSYSTCRSIFEAQNQSAVSGACALRMLHDLAELKVKNVDGGNYAKSGDPLVFSVCTEGPIHELWAHYTTVVAGSRVFNMVMVKTCHMGMRSSILEFLIAVDNIMTRGSGDFLDNIAERLGRVAEYARQAAGENKAAGGDKSTGGDRSAE